MDASSWIGSLPGPLQWVLGLALAAYMIAAALQKIASAAAIRRRHTAIRTATANASTTAAANSWHAGQTIDRIATARGILLELVRLAGLFSLLFVAFMPSMPIDSRLAAVLLLGLAFAILR